MICSGSELVKCVLDANLDVWLKNVNCTFNLYCVKTGFPFCVVHNLFKCGLN